MTTSHCARLILGAFAATICAIIPRDIAAAEGATTSKQTDRSVGNESEARFKVLEKGNSRLLYDVLLRSAQEQFEERRKVVAAALQTPEAVREYQASIRTRVEDIKASFPQRTPLNAKTTGSIQCKGYRIENVVFESVPNLHVSGNLYVPTSSTGPFPAVLIASGHSSNGKAQEKYQSAAILLAKNGFVALLIDTFSQGERRLGVDHTQINIGAMLVGTNIVAYQAWDNIRAIDYLCSRPEVDAERIGVTGNSGGGTQSMYLLAFDPRIKVAAPSCALQTRELMFKYRGLADGCHNFPGEGLRMLEYADYFIQFAPKPVLVLAGERDTTFLIEGASKTVREAKWFYKELGALDRVDLFTVDEGHGFQRGLREAAVWWFDKWLKNDVSAVKESEPAIQTDAALSVTKSGQVLSEFKGARSIIDVNIERAEGLADQRHRFWTENSKQVAMNKVKALINYVEVPNSRSGKGKEVGQLTERGMQIHKLQLTSRDGFPLPALLYVPEGAVGPLPATLYIDPRGKQHAFDPEPALRTMFAEKRIMLAVDTRGYGETKVDLGNLRKDLHASNDQHSIAQTALYIGRPLMGQRVQDGVDALEYLFANPMFDKKDVEVVGVGECGLIALHLAAIDERVSKVTVVRSISSWMDIIRAPKAKNQLQQVVPGAMLFYDLPDLASAIAPRLVNFVEPVDAFGRAK